MSFTQAALRRAECGAQSQHQEKGRGLAGVPALCGSFTGKKPQPLKKGKENEARERKLLEEWQRTARKNRESQNRMEEERARQWQWFFMFLITMLMFRPPPAVQKPVLAFWQ